MVRVSRRGRATRLPAQFHLFSLFLLRSLYLSTIGLAAVFSLGWTLPPVHSAIPNTATPSLSPVTGLSPSAARLSRSVLSAVDISHNNTRLHSGLFPLRSPLLRESLLVSFPPSTHMLNSKGLSCLRSFGHVASLLPLRHISLAAAPFIAQRAKRSLAQGIHNKLNSQVSV